MERNLSRVQRLFTVTIVGLSVASMASLLLVLYLTSVISFADTTSPSELDSLTAGYPAVATYLDEQKQSEAHFITLANLVKDDQQRLLGRTALLVAAPLLIASAVLGYLLARYLLRPVADAYASQERFLQDAAHELRNPLATMSAVIQQAKQRGDSDMNSKLAVLERQTNQMVHINEDLLFLERRTRSAHPEAPYDAAELLRDVVETLQPLAAENKAKVSVQGQNIALSMRQDDFVCLARNLLENAIKYGKPGKPNRVQAILEQTTRGTLFRVTDTGIGIPAADLPNIGKRFYRAGNVSRKQGTGLGFAIVNKIVAEADGRLDIDSTEGKGTSVTVFLRR